MATTAAVQGRASRQSALTCRSYAFRSHGSVQRVALATVKRASKDQGAGTRRLTDRPHAFEHQFPHVAWPSPYRIDVELRVDRDFVPTTLGVERG